MANSPIRLRGVVHGRIIELDREPGISDGQPVSVVVSVSDASRPYEGIERSAGAWAEAGEDLDHWLREIRRARRNQRREPAL